MSTYRSDSSLITLNADMRNVIKLQLTAFIDCLDEASKRSRAAGINRSGAIGFQTAQSLHRLRENSSGRPAA